MKRVFFSYSHSDKDVARRLNDVLRRANVGTVSTWSDEFGKVLLSSRDLREAIASAEAMVVVISSSGLSNSWLQFELGAAYSLGKPVYGVLVEWIPKDRRPDWLTGITLI